MKGLFLLSQKEPQTVGMLSHFSAYRYGPFDIGIYDDLEALKQVGRVRTQITPDGQWAYESTALGRAAAVQVKQNLAGHRLARSTAGKQVTLELRPRPQVQARSGGLPRLPRMSAAFRPHSFEVAIRSRLRCFPGWIR